MPAHPSACATRVSVLLLALGGWRRHVFLVDFVQDGLAHCVISVSGQDSPWTGHQAQVVEEGVPLLDPVLQEKTVSKCVIADRVLYLEKETRCETEQS